MVASSALTALYPGSFDPFHNGHLDVVEQSVELFGAVVIAVMHNPQKPSGLIDLGRRVELVQACVSHLPTVRVAAHPGLAVDAARAEKVNFIVKGLRTHPEISRLSSKWLTLITRYQACVRCICHAGQANLLLVVGLFATLPSIMGRSVIWSLFQSPALWQVSLENRWEITGPFLKETHET